MLTQDAVNDRGVTFNSWERGGKGRDEGIGKAAGSPTDEDDGVAKRRVRQASLQDIDESIGGEGARWTQVIHQETHRLIRRNSDRAKLDAVSKPDRDLLRP